MPAPRFPALPSVRAGISEGLSPSASYRRYTQQAHAAGLTGMRMENYLHMYSEIRATRGNVPEAMDRPKNVVPSQEQIERRTTINARGYGTWVTAYQRHVGSSDLMEQRFLIKSDAPISPEEAERRTGVLLANNDDIYDRVTLGISYTGTEFYTPQAGQYPE